MNFLGIFIGLFALVCLGLAFQLHSARNSWRFAVLRDLPETARTWLQLLFFPDLGKRVSHADQLQVKLALPWAIAQHMQHGTARTVRVARVDVPVGCIGLLGVRTQDGRQVFDSGAFCLFPHNEQSEIPLWLVQRSFRWQVLLKKMLPTPDTKADLAGVRFHVAVHTTLADVGDLEQLSPLAGGCQSYLESVHKWVESALASYAARHSYEAVTRRPDAILEHLTERWEAEHTQVIPQLHSLIQTRFTGVVAKLLHYKEDALFEDLLRAAERKRLDYHSIFNDFQRKRTELNRKYVQHVEELRTRFEEITGQGRWSPENRGPAPTPESSVDRSMSAAITALVANSIEIAIKNFSLTVDTLRLSFESAFKKVERATNDLIEAAGALTQFVEALKKDIEDHADQRTTDRAADSPAATERQGSKEVAR